MIEPVYVARQPGMVEKSAQDGEDEPEVQKIPMEFALRTFPNPFNPETQLELSLPQRTIVSVRVFDLKSRLVRARIPTSLKQLRAEFGDDKKGTQMNLNKARMPLIIVIILVLNVFPIVTNGMIPFFVHDNSVKIVDWSDNRKLLKPEIATLIEENGVVILEAGNYLGDAGYFFDPPNLPRTMQYLGFGALWFGEVNSQIDPFRMAKTREGNYYHSTDPSTLQGWRTADAVELRWTPDYRFVTRAYYDELSSDSPTGEVDSYLLRRLTLDGSQTEVNTLIDGSITEFKDENVSSGISYGYSLFSIATPGGDPVPYSATPDTVSGQDGALHFWAEKLDYQERHYDNLPGHMDENFIVTWPFKFMVDDDIVNSSNVTIEVVLADTNGVYTYDELTGLSYTYDALSGIGTLTYNWATDTDYMRDHGGVVYRLRYDVGGNEYYYPAEDVLGKRHFIWSSINNRTMGVQWLNYVMNTSGADWQLTYLEMVTRLANGLDLTSGLNGEVVPYDRVFMDSVLAANTSTHNIIRPYEFTNDEDYVNGAIATTKVLCDADVIDFVANTPSLKFIGGMTGYPRFVGIMNENLHMGDDGWAELANLLWVTRGRPNWQNILAARMDFGANVWDRKQMFIAYLLAREGQPTAGSENISFGYLGWENAPEEEKYNVNVFAEQFLNVLDSVNDPFATTTWPPVNQWGFSDISDFVIWLNTNAPSFVETGGGRNFAVRDFYLENGVPGIELKTLVLWDLGATASGAYTLGELFPNLSEEDVFYRAIFDNASITQGGWISSEGKADGTPYTRNEAILSSTGDVQLFFTSPIKSPTIEPQAIYTLPSGPGHQPLVAVRASHWNGQTLEKLELYSKETVNGIDIGWPDKVVLTDDGLSGGNGDEVAGDGIYSWAAPAITGSSPGYFEFSIVATGNDGLMKFDTVRLQIAEGPDISFINESLNTRNLAGLDENDQPNGSGVSDPYAAAAFDYSGDGLNDLFVTQGSSGTGIGRMYNCLTIDNGVPVFLFSNGIAFESGSEPGVNLNNVALAHFDDDAKIDFFVAGSDSSSLYVWGVNGYKNIASQTFGGTIPQAYDAAWADYNKDGSLDLVVAKSPMPEEGPSGIVQQSSSGGGMPMGIQSHLFKHVYTDPDSHSLEYVLDPNLFSSGSHYSYEVSWCDPNGDSLPDIFISDLLYTNSSTLLINQGLVSGGEYGFLDETSSWFPVGDPPNGVRSAVFLDYDNDGKSDLVTSHWSQDDNLVVYHNEGSGFSIGDKPAGNIPVEKFSLNGLAVEDFDGNGLDDIMVLPYVDSQQPYLLLNGIFGDSGVFSKYSALKLGYQKSKGVAIADWGEDGDFDLYVARPSSDANFYFKNLRDPAAEYDWIKIQLSGGGSGSENISGIGAQIDPVGILVPQGKTMLSNGGRNESPLEIVFPLGDYSADTLSVVVTWPSGHVQTSVCDVNGLNIIEDDSYLIDSSSVSSSYMPNPSGGTDWVFEWVTKGPTPKFMDKVHVAGTTDTSSPCYCGGVFDLDDSMGSVEVTVTQEAGGWRHKLVWGDGCCYAQKPACTTLFDVESGNLIGSDSSVNHTFVKFKVCGAGF